MKWFQFLSSLGAKQEALSPVGPLEIFSRQCLSSSISRHKKRPPGFSREACYRNLLNTFDAARANLTFFLDVAGGTRSDHFLKGESRYPVVEIQAGSEAGSFLQLLDYVEGLNLNPATWIYFVEDDYLHREGWIDILFEGFQIPGIEYVTLYDHKDKYFFPEYRKLTSKIYATPSCHWRTTPSTTNTFAVRYETLLRHLPIHRRFSEKRTISADHEKFCLLGKLRSTLISPMPGWSTHAEPEYASPCVDWDEIIQN